MTVISVSDLLPDTLRNIDTALQRERVVNPELASAKLPDVAMAVVGDKATEAIRAALDCDPLALLARAWGAARELHEFTDETKHPPGEISAMFLGEHALTSEVHPVVGVVVGTFCRFQLRFTLELDATIRMAELTIRNKHVTEIGKCDCEVSAVLKYADIPLHDPLKSKHIALTSPMVLVAPGIPIV